MLVWIFCWPSCWSLSGLFHWGNVCLSVLASALIWFLCSFSSHSLYENIMSQILVFLDWTSNVLIFSCLVKKNISLSFSSIFWKMVLTSKIFTGFFVGFCFCFCFGGYLMFNFQELFCLFVFQVFFLMPSCSWFTDTAHTLSSLKILLMALKQEKGAFLLFPVLSIFSSELSFVLSLSHTHTLPHSLTRIFLCPSCWRLSPCICWAFAHWYLRVKH